MNFMCHIFTTMSIKVKVSKWIRVAHAATSAADA